MSQRFPHPMFRRAALAEWLAQHEGCTYEQVRASSLYPDDQYGHSSKNDLLCLTAENGSREHALAVLRSL